VNLGGFARVSAEGWIFAEETGYDHNQEDRYPRCPLVQIAEGKEPDGAPLVRTQHLQRLTARNSLAAALALLRR
jgi:hypothetical protein